MTMSHSVQPWAEPRGVSRLHPCAMVLHAFCPARQPEAGGLCCSGGGVPPAPASSEQSPARTPECGLTPPPPLGKPPLHRFGVSVVAGGGAQSPRALRLRCRQRALSLLQSADARAL